MVQKCLKPAAFCEFKKKLYGFDIETYDRNKKFLMATVHCDEFCRHFYDKRELIDFFKKRRLFQNSWVAATNLQFDFMGTFYGEKEAMQFSPLFRGSDMLLAKATFGKGGFDRGGSRGSMGFITFVDTLNYAKMSVSNAGKFLKLPKLVKPPFLGRKPKNKREWEEMRIYNMRDAEISHKLMKFFIASFSSLGATMKSTIAATSMSLFKNKYLHETYYTHDIPMLREQFKGYYGGNTHAYARGKIKDYYYYDFNSLYPSVMRNEFPDPNTVRTNTLNSQEYIDSYDGMALVKVCCSYMKYPLLPYRYDGKLLFPIGSWTGWYSNAELREAKRIKYYEIKKVYKNIYCKKNCEPFYDFVRDMWRMRKEYQEGNNPMQMVVKLLMNSLYGKFGQKFDDRDNVVPFAETLDELKKYKSFERIGDYMRVKESCMPSSFCIPLWALYVTAYGRILLYDKIAESEAIYADTDSIVTKKRYLSSTSLGKLKLESIIKDGIIVKPKFYLFDGISKLKGAGQKLSRLQFISLMDDPHVRYEKFTKFREALRRNFLPNELQEVEKAFSLEDNKRDWAGRFDASIFESSVPPYMINGERWSYRCGENEEITVISKHIV